MDAILVRPATAVKNSLDHTSTAEASRRKRAASALAWATSREAIRSLRRLYPGEISSVRMLGVDQELRWSLTRGGLEIEPPAEPPCEAAFVFKIARRNPF